MTVLTDWAKDLWSSRRVCWYETNYWTAGTFMWFGGETADKNDTMGARPQANSFRTYALRRHSTTPVWGSYFSQSYVKGHCAPEGFNTAVQNCTGLTTNGFGGFYVWND
jgi:hypothetical protein